MESAGLFSIEDRRPVNEARIRARAKLGRLLEHVARGHGPGRGKKNAQSRQSFLAYLRELGLERKRADEIQQRVAVIRVVFRRGGI